MNLKECITEHLKNCGLKKVGRDLGGIKPRLRRFKKNHIKYAVVLDYDNCTVTIWKMERKAKPRTSVHDKIPAVRGGAAPDFSQKLTVNLYDPNSLKQIVNFV